MTLDRCCFLSQKYPENTLIAMDERRSLDLSAMEIFVMRPFKLEIIALYVLKDYYGKVSEQLMHAAFDVLNHF